MLEEEGFRFIFGAAGGIAPEVLRFYGMRMGPTPAEVRRVFYWASVGGFILLAGTMGWILARDAVTAFGTGVGTPFLVRGILARASESGHGPGPSIEEVTLERASPLRRLRCVIEAL